MLTATRSPQARRFAVRGVLAGVLLFGLLRLRWMETYVLLPLTTLQGDIAAQTFGTHGAPIDLTLACSGAETLAACLAATWAYPARWHARAAGAMGGVLVVGLLNTLRIGTLGLATASPAWFDPLHLYLWPVGLTMAVVGYLCLWMAFADRRSAGVPPRGAWRTGPLSRFVALTVVFLLAFASTSALHLHNPRLLTLAGGIASATAVVLRGVGIAASAAGNVLWTPNGGFLVTSECVVTPLVAVYLAAIVVYSPTWSRVAIGLFATIPVFLSLAVVRLLVVALPASIEPLFLVHAFYQLLVAAILVCLAAHWRHHDWRSRYALAGLSVGVLFLWLLGPLYADLIGRVAPPPAHDPQAALGMLPPFQIALYLALLTAASATHRWRAALAGLAILAATQMVGLLGLGFLYEHSSTTLNVSVARGWALAAPVLAWLVVAPRGDALP